MHTPAFRPPLPRPDSSPRPDARSGLRRLRPLFTGIRLTAPLLAVALLAAGCSGSSPEGDDDDQTPTPTPEPTPTPPVGQLHAPVEVQFDSTGAPHIYASSDHDLFFSQGWLAARDRLWQLEVTRKQALGQLTEIYGSGSLSSDMIVRGFQPMEHARAELDRWKTAYPRQLTWIDAYVAGVNAYIDDALAERNGATLPPEYEALGLTPQPLTTDEMAAMDFMFAASQQGDPFIELTATLIGLLVGEEVTQDVLRMQPIEPAFSVPDAERALSTGSRTGATQEYRTSASSTAPSSGTVRRAGTGTGTGMGGPVDPELDRYIASVLAEPGALDKIRAAITALPQHPLWDGRGSNGWVVHGEHTTTGGPLLAGDTHMGIGLPQTFHQVHLNTAEAGGDIDAMGVTAIGGPGLIIGHSARVGWTMTTSMVDVNDLYLERPSPTDPLGAVMFKGEAILYQTWDETFRVRQGDGSFIDEVHTLKRLPHHGQVLPAEALGLPSGLILSLRWAGEQPGTVIGTLQEFMLSQGMDQLEAAMEGHRIGCNNIIMATVDGDIAFDARVHIPLREAYDPDNPPWLALPGSGGYEWTGDYIPAADALFAVNPPAGFAVSANNDAYGNTADGDPLNDEYYVGAFYDSGMRARRLDTWLRDKIENGGRISPDDMHALQADVHSMIADRLVPFALDAASRRPDLLNADMSTAVDLLKAWDHDMSGDSAAAPIFIAWWTIALQEIFQDELDPSIFDWVSGDTMQFYARPLVYFLEATADQIDDIDAGSVPFPSLSGLNYFDDQATTDKVETRDEQLLEALKRAVDHYLPILGPDLNAWRWDAVHTLTMYNSSSGWLNDPTLNKGPFPMEGDSYSLDVAEGVYYTSGNPPAVYTVGKVPTIRMVLDFSGGTVRAMNTIPGGQSERGSSPHYADQTDTWIQNHNRQLPFTRAEVETDAEAQWTLPAGFPDSELIQEKR